ncbi:MAG: hypothetical protein WDO73_36955 [Ignavibacteriota bacterium]
MNVFESGFLQQFNTAAQNLAIARQTSPTSTNFGNQGLPGQQAIPMISTALGTTNGHHVGELSLAGAGRQFRQQHRHQCHPHGQPDQERLPSRICSR